MPDALPDAGIPDERGSAHLPVRQEGADAAMGRYRITDPGTVLPRKNQRVGVISGAVWVMWGPLNIIRVMIPKVLRIGGFRNPASVRVLTAELIDCKADSHFDHFHFMSSVDTGFVDFRRRCRQTDKTLASCRLRVKWTMLVFMREPSLLVPYPGPDSSGNTFDVYVYLRPETNGVLTESVLMKTVIGRPDWRNDVKLVYLANYPGDFIQTRHLIEHHYRTRIFFAREGARAFTPGMRRAFEQKFGTEFIRAADQGRILGAFDALESTGLTEEELFDFRVDEPDMLEVLGQNIKKRDKLWIVNYDIPALLRKNDSRTDIAVMVFRAALDWESFREVVKAMGDHLAEAGIISPGMPPSRAFHHSHSPWEQLLDGIEFLWGVDVSDGGAEDDISFGAYMMERGWSREQLKDVIRHPLVGFRTAGQNEEKAAPSCDEEGICEGNIFDISAGMTYAEAEELMDRVTGPLPVDS